MFKIKKKIKLTYDERRIILYSLNDFRTKILKEGKCVDVINEAMCEVKPKMKAKKDIIGVIVNALINMKEEADAENLDTAVIKDLILKLYEEYKTLK